MVIRRIIALLGWLAFTAASYAVTAFDPQEIRVATGKDVKALVFLFYEPANVNSHEVLTRIIHQS